MPRIAQTALTERARTLLVAMGERERWIYALPRPGTADWLASFMEGQGVPRLASEADGAVVKYGLAEGAAGSPMHFVAFDNPDLDVVLLEAHGASAAPLLRAIVEARGFVPQSRLWGLALDVADPGCVGALATLAHMAAVWDEDWTDLFILHLASPDAVVRHAAVTSLVVAAMVANAPAPALELLAEASTREKLPQLQKAMEEAAGVVRAFRGDPVSLA